MSKKAIFLFINKSTNISLAALRIMGDEKPKMRHFLTNFTAGNFFISTF